MWWGALIGGASGVLAAVIAKLVIRDSKSRPMTYLFVVIFLFASLNGAGSAYLRPKIRVWEARQEVSKLVAENRLFSVLAARHPEIHDQIATLMVDVSRRGASPKEANLEGFAWGRELIRPYFDQYAPIASSDSLGRFVSVTVEILEQLSAREDEACYFWMFGGQTPPGFSFSDAISQSDQTRMADAMADVIESSIPAPREPLDAKQAGSAIESFIGGLMETHGEAFVASLAILQQPNAPNIDKRAACDAATEFYRAALGLPEAQQGPLLRSLFGAAAS
jgi:hypothetical protein